MAGRPQEARSAASAHFWMRVLSRRERVKNLLSWPYAWHYVRQTRLVEPLWSWWVNRG